MSEKKESIKISMSTFFLIIAIIVIGVLAYVMYVQKTTSDKQVADLEKKEASMQAAINNSSNMEVAKSDDEEDTFTDEQVKKVITDYFNHFRGVTGVAGGSPLGTLKDMGAIQYSSEKDEYVSGVGNVTNVKFSDYKKAMLNYFSEAEFESVWTSECGISKNEEGYVIYEDGGKRKCTCLYHRKYQKSSRQ